MEGDGGHENHSKWLAEYYQIISEEGGNDDDDDVNHTLDILRCIRRLEAQIRDSDNDDEEDDPGQISKKLCHMIYYHLMDLSALSFVHDRLNNKSESSKFLRKFQTFLQKCVESDQVSVEHEKGFNYVVNFIGDFGSSMTTTSFAELSPRARACVYGIKQRFLHVYGIATLHDINTLKEAVKLESDFYHWHLILYRKYRTARKRAETNQPKREILEPTEEEKEEILKACQLNPDHPWCLVHEILMLADLQNVQKGKWTNIQHNSAQYSWTFRTRKGLIEWMKTQAEKILELAPESNVCVSTVAMIFNKLIKPRMEELGWLEESLVRVLGNNPHCSKSCFALAELYLSKKNYDGAEECFEKAVDYSPISYHLGYWVCFIQTLMRDPVKNGGKLEEIFEKQFRNPDWKNDKTKPMNRIKFLQALYLLTIPSKTEEALDILCELCKESEDFLLFRVVSYQFFRFGWEHPNFKLEKVKEIISSEMKEAEKQNLIQDPGRQELLFKIITQINQALEEDRRSQFHSSRGGGRFQRGRGQFQRSRGGEWRNFASSSRGYRHENNTSGIDAPSWR